MVLLGFFLASGSSVPLKTECGVVLPLGLQDGLWQHQCAGMLTASGAEVMGLLESFSSFWQLVFKGPLWQGSFSIAQCIRHLKGYPL